MTPHEKLIVDLVRLGLKGDAPSIRRLTTKLLRTAPSPNGEDEKLRSAIAKLLLDEASAPHLTREVQRLGAPVDANSFMSLTRIEHPTDAAPALLAADTDRVVRRVLEERKNPQMLARVGMEPTRTLLLTGPPGVGKTMTARYLAASLEIPLVTIDLSTLISSYLGRTGNNLRQVLDYAKSTACVFLMDEFDALGKRRDDPSDVGELKRIVNVLLLELDQWPPHSLLVAATNHPELLDKAVWRRFEQVIDLSLPDAAIRRAMTSRLLAAYDKCLDAEQLDIFVQATECASGSDIDTFVRSAVRSVAMGSNVSLAAQLTSTAMDRLRKLGSENKDLRAAYCGIANERLNLSQRDIAADMNVSHTVVGRLVQVWRKKNSKPSLS